MTAHVKKLSGWTTVLLLVLLVAGCALPSTNGVTQVSTIDALLAGVYDGHMPLQALRQYGNFGLGTFEHLDGEMLLIDGTFYKVKFDGSVQVPPGTEGTPFAAVTYFVPDQTTAVQTPVDMAGLEAQIDQILAQPNRIGAFRVQGSFRRMVTRSVPAQTKPYPPLAEVTKLQAVFNFENVEGTLIGYRLRFGGRAAVGAPS